MIRQPSTMSDLYRWHRSAIAGDELPVHDGIPECGWYRTRLVKGGPWCAVEIRVEREICPDTGELLGPERLIAICDGMRRDPARMWTFITPITRAEHDALIRRREAIPAMAATMARLDLTKEPMRP
jgi:hypothetical protein